MVSTLLFISFIIHIVLLIVTWQLMKQVKTLKDNQPEDIMEIFETYLEEVREENRLLQNELSNNNQLYKVDTVETVEKPVNTSGKEPISDATSNDEPTSGSTFIHGNDEIDKSQNENDVTLSFEANVLHLNSQGLTIEEIAKKLNRGKTEVMLIIKFHSKNKQ